MSTLPAAKYPNRQRLGWLFLLGGFSIFLTIAISIPLFINNYLKNSVEPLTTAVQANQGTVGIEDPDGQRRAALVGQTAQTMAANATIRTDATATALLNFFTPDGDQLLSRLQIYGNTTMRLTQAEAPQFEYSELSQKLAMALENGRMQLTVPERDGRPLIIQIETPHGQVQISDSGSYSIDVINLETQVSVQSGQAALLVGPEPFLLLADERAVIPIGAPPQGPFPTQRNLIRNGNFSELLERWTLYTWNVELSDQPKGSTEVITISGVPALRITRQGLGAAEVKIRQVLNQDVTDFQSLRLQATFQIVDQSLSVCGTLGSECPLFIKINYLDPNGANRIWQQGFFASGEINPEGSPDGCVSCAVFQSVHERIVLDQVKFFDVDLIEALARQGALPPKFIESVELAFLGHSFEVDVFDLALLVE